MPSSQSESLISADNEWSPLKVAIVGRADHSAFPSEPRHMIVATMPEEHHSNFKPANPFPADVVEKAGWELDNLARILEEHEVRVLRPQVVNWVDAGGYTGAMPRDCLMTVGNTLIESAFAWRCRRNEVQLGYMDIIKELSARGSSRICRAPVIVGQDTLYNGREDPTPDHVQTNGHANGTTNGYTHQWAINNSRPAFDAADFMRLGNTLIGQLSNVTNRKGVDYLQAIVPEGYTVEILDTNDEHAMHIDATILPLREKLLVYNPLRVTERELRKHKIFADWDLRPYPFATPVRDSSSPPMYMCSAWLVLNALSLDGRKILIEENDVEFANWLRDECGMDPILCPLRHVHSLGGSFHCATVDLVRSTG